MIKLDLQFFGGRGSSSSSGGGSGGGGGQIGRGKMNRQGLAGQTYFEDGNKVSVGGTLSYWEGKSKGLKHEELLMIGEDGFAQGYFKGGKTSVAFEIPAGVDPSKTVLTHNHPYGNKATGGRTIGGGFSDADVTNHIQMGFKETRATSIEGTYSFKAAKGKTPDSKGFLSALSKRKSAVQKAADKAYTKPGNTKSYIDIYLEQSHKWYQRNTKQYGYEYSLIKSKK